MIDTLPDTGSVITIRASDRCPDCNHHLYQHKRRKVYTEGGRYYYKLECPEVNDDE